MVATALGGPLAGAATGALVKALGKDGQVDPASPEAVDAMLADAVMRPEQIVQIRQAELDFKRSMAELQIKSEADLERILADDRNSARNREIQLRDRMPGILAIGVTLGFFGILAWTMVRPVPPESRDLLNVMLGALGTAWISVISYYFGSSAGSARKTDLLGGQR